MGRAFALMLTATVVGVDAGSAQAGSTTLVIPAKGEIVRLGNSGVECSWGSLRSGVRYVSCGVADARHRPLANSYAATLLDTGRVNVLSARSGKVVFSRATASAAGTPSAHLAVGDGLRVPGTALACSIVDADGAAAICYRADEKGARAGSYGFAVGRRVVLVMAYDGKRHPRSTGAWPQPVR